MFHRTRTVGNRGTWHLVVTLMCSDVQSVIEHILLNITERMCGIAKKTRTLTEQPPKNVSYVLISSNALTAKKTIKQTVIPIYFGITISTGIGTVENNRNSFESRVHIV